MTRQIIFPGLLLASLFFFGGCTRVDYEPISKTAPPSPSLENRLRDAEARRGKHYARRLALFLEDTPKQKPGGTVFVGDSITEGFPLDRAFPVKTSSTAVSAETTSPVLLSAWTSPWRISHPGAFIS